MKTVFLALLPCVSCAAAPEQPPWSHPSGAGDARAWSEADAARLGRALEVLGPRVRELLGSHRAPPRVRIDRNPLPGVLTGYTSEDEIVLGMQLREQPEATLAHELAHWYLDGEWDLLPPALEEGLADLVAVEVLPEIRVCTQRQHALVLDTSRQLPSWEEVLRLDTEDCKDVEHARRTVAARAMGYLLAKRIGVAGLRELCAMAHAQGLAMLPSDLVLQRSGLDSTSEAQWRHALDTRVRITFKAGDGSVILSRECGIEDALQVPPGAVRLEYEVID